MKSEDLFVRAQYWDALKGQVSAVPDNCPNDICQFAGDFARMCAAKAAECREIAQQLRKEEK